MNINQALNYSTNFLNNIGQVNSRAISELFLSNILKLDKINLYLNARLDLDKNQLSTLYEYLERRKTKEPVQYILNSVDFYGNNYYVECGVFIPRVETEILVEKCIGYINSKIDIKSEHSFKCLDICTGCGIIPISISSYVKNCCFIGLDISNKAIKCARYNLEKINSDLNVRFYRDDIYDFHNIKYLNKSNCFDLIVSNPPYVPSKYIEDLPDEIKKFEPLNALDGGDDGLRFAINIINYACFALKKNGLLALELDPRNINKAYNYIKVKKFSHVKIIDDLTKTSRFLISIK